MSTSPVLGLTLMTASQAQKETVFNEFLIAMDALFRGSVLDASLSIPPATPNEGDAYIINVDATGLWSGYDNQIAFYFNGWQFVSPPTKITLFDVAGNAFYQFQGGTLLGGTFHWALIPNTTVAVLNDLTDVSITSPTNGEVMTYNSTTSKWNAEAATFTATLASLTDVSVTEGSAIDQFVLFWDNTDSKWEAKALAPPPTFLTLPDVSLTGVANGFLLEYTSTGPGVKFVDPLSLVLVASLANVGDVTYASGLAVGDVLQWTGSVWAPTILTAFTLAGLSDVSVTEGAGIDGCVLTWNNAAGKWVPDVPATGGGATTLAGLSDVSVAEGSGIDGKVLYWHNADNRWEAEAIAAVALSGAYADLAGKPTIPGNSSFNLAGLGDVTIASLANGQVLEWNSTASKWENVTPSSGGGGGGSSTLSGDSDVAISSPTSGQVLTYNGTAWANAAPTGGTGGSGAGAVPPTVVQTASFCQQQSPYTLGAAPTPGNLLVCIQSRWTTAASVGAGWTRASEKDGSDDDVAIFIKVVPYGDTANQSPMSSEGGTNCTIWELSGALTLAPVAATLLTDQLGATLTIDVGAPANSILLGQFGSNGSDSLPTGITGATAGNTATQASGSGGGLPRGVAAFSKSFTSAGGAAIVASYAGSMDCSIGAVAIIGAAGAAIGGNMLAPPVSTNLTAFRSLGSATLTDRSSGAIPSLHVEAGTVNDQTLYCALEAAPSGNFSIVVKVRGTCLGGASGYTGAGPVVYNSANGHAVYNWLVIASNPQFFSGNCTALNNISAGLGGNQPDGDFFQHIDYDGTNIKHGLSRNGVDVIWAGTATVAGFIGAITHVGVGWSSSVNTDRTFDFLHYFAGTQGDSGILASSGGGGGSGGASPPTLSTLSYQALSSVATLSTSYVAGKGLTVMRTDNGYGGGDTAAFQGQAVPGSTPWTVTMQARQNNFGVNYTRTGIGLYNSSGGAAIAFTFNSQGGAPSLTIFETGSGLTTYASTIATLPLTVSTPIPEWFQVTFDGTTYTFSISFDDSTWFAVGTVAAASYFTATHVGLIIETYTNWTSPAKTGATILNYAVT